MRRQPGAIKKSFIILNLVFLFCFLLVIFLVGVFLGIPEYYSYEMKKVDQRVEQLDRLINMEIEHLDLYCRDWALWNDTWNFIQDGNKSYQNSNLGAASLEIGGLSFFFFFNLKGELVYGGAVDPDTGLYFEPDNLELPLSFKELLYTREGEMRELVETGFMQDPENGNVYLFSSRNILKSDISGPSTGSLVAGRVLSDRFLMELGNTLHMSPLNLDKNHPESSSVVTGLGITYNLKRTPIFSNELWRVVYSLKPFFQNKRMYLSFEHRPDILLQGLWVVALISSIFALTFMVLLGLYQFWVSRIVLKPILNLTTYVEQECSSLSIDEPDSEHSLNEITRLSRRFYYLLGKLSDKNRDLSVQAQTDDLTGLERRVPVLEKLNSACSRESSGSKERVSVVMIDIDYFKRINDTWGHPVGDEVIRGLAPVLRAGLRDGDTIGRYGGEEFIIILKDLPEAVIRKLAERIRQRVESENWSFGEKVTVSIGYDIQACPCSPSVLIQNADENLYKAKHNGRNRTEGPAASGSIY